MTLLSIQPLDPLVARDGRPFGADSGNRMYLLPFPLPSTVAGSLRTMVGKTILNGDFNTENVGKLKALKLRGPLLRRELGGTHRYYFSKPMDYLPSEELTGGKIKPHHVQLVPRELAEQEGTDLPHGLLPTVANSKGKPAPSPSFWSLDRMIDWLTMEDVSKWENAPPRPDAPDQDSLGYLTGLEVDERTHVKILPDSLTSADGQLFVSAGLCFPTDSSLALEATGGLDLNGISQLHPLGGERRLATWSATPPVDDTSSPWRCPNQISNALKDAKMVRMILATPGIFKDGWKPGWLSEQNGLLEGTPPGAPAGLKLRLKAACVDRYQPLSGYSLENGSVGPKKVRRMAPSGSVYFFEVLSGNPSDLKSLWLESVCDDSQDRNDGFGLVLWGNAPAIQTADTQE